MKKQTEQQMNFSIVDTIQKYTYDTSENLNSRTYVPWGSDNLFPNFINNMVKDSATLTSVLSACKNMAAGDDVVIGEKLTTWKERVNRKGETLQELIESIAYDYFKFGGFAIQVIYSKLGTVVELYAIDFARCRVNADKTKIYYNKRGWSKYSSAYEEFDVFDRDNFKADKPTQIYWFSNPAIKTHYPYTDYQGAFNDILTEIEVSRYNLNTVSNGFSARHVVNLPNSANYTEEQKKAIEDGIKEKFCGSDTPSNFMLYFSPDTNKIEVQKLESADDAERYIAIEKISQRKIFAAFHCNGNIIGIPTENNGFNNEEYESALKLFNRLTIKPAQNTIIRVLEKIFGIKNEIKIIPFSTNLENND